MTLADFELNALTGGSLDSDLLRDKVVLLVNVASKCLLTPQYEGLENLQKRYADRGFTVLGVPCNQFAEQEPGEAEEIAEFCSTTYGVTFPLAEKTEVNGARRHPLYEWLCSHAPQGDAGSPEHEIEWNFEKFLIGREGEVKARFRPTIQPESDEVISAIEAAL